MKHIKLILIYIFSLFLFSCGGGGGASSDSVKVKINISKDAFTQYSRSIAYGGKLIDKIQLAVSGHGAAQNLEIQDSVESGTPVELVLTANKTYTFQISALDTQSEELCSGSDSAFISKDVVTNVTLDCVSGGVPVFVTGIAASGLPIEGVVYLKDKNGTVVMADIQPDGSFDIDVSELTPPYIMRAEGKVGDKFITLYSVASGDSDTANINPYTNLALSIAVGGLDLDSVFTDPASSQDKFTTENMTAAVGVVRNIFTSMFAAMGITDFDPINGSYSADGSGMDGVLDNLSINVSGGNINIVNTNTGESVVSVTVANAGSASVPASVAQEVASYVSAGATTGTEVKAFINDFVTTRSRAFTDYFSTSLTWLNGKTRADIIAQDTFPDSTKVAGLDSISIVSRSGANNVTVYFVLKMTDGTLEANTGWLVKENGSWYFTGNGLQFARKITPVSVLTKSASGNTVNSGLDINLSDPAQRGIQLFVVTGAGLPAAGLKYYYDSGTFKLADSSNAPTSSISYMTDANINTANSSFMLNGYIKYTISAYLEYSGAAYTPVGTALQTADFFMRKPIETAAAMSGRISDFIIQDNLTSYDLNVLLASSTVNVTTSTDTIEDFANGIVTYKCNNSITSETEMLSHSITPSAPDFSFTVQTTPLTALNSCKAYMVYFDTLFRKFMTYAVVSRTATTVTSTDLLQTAANTVTFNTIKGANSSSSSVTANLVLPTSLTGGITVAWSSNNTSVISNTGVVTRPAAGSANSSVTLTATLSLGETTLQKTFAVTVTAQAVVVDYNAVLQSVKDALSFESIAGANQYSSYVTGDLSLPTVLSDVVSLTWSSSNTSVISNTGVVTRPAYGTGDATVTLTATLTYGGSSITFNVSVTVLAVTEIDQNVQADADEITLDSMLGLNKDSSGVIFDLNFPEAIGTHGSTVSCVSSNTSYISNTGEIVARPTASVGAVTLVVTCTVDPAVYAIEKSFTFAIPSIIKNTIAGGDGHSIAIASDGTLWGWGDNESYQVGLGSDSNTEYFYPQLISNSSDWAAVAAGSNFSIALKTDGTIWGWGDNAHYSLTDSSASSEYVPVQIEVDTNSDGIDQDWVMISADGYTVLALKADGTLWATGNNESGELGVGNTNQVTAFTQVGDGSVKWAFISAGANHSLAIATDGTLYSWGTGSMVELCISGSPTSIETPTAVTSADKYIFADATYGRTYAINADGELFACGTNYNGSLGLGVVNDEYELLTQIGSDTDWESISGGYDQTLAVKKTGALYVWGLNDSDAIGFDVGDMNPLLTPTQLGTDTNWKFASAGQYHSLAMKNTTSILAWGYNSFGAVGDGNTNGDNRGTPYLVTLFAGISPDDVKHQLALGSQHSVAVMDGFMAFLVGDDSNGELGLNPADIGVNKTVLTPETVAFTSGGDVQVTIPIFSVTAGLQHSAFLTAENSLVYTGYSNIDGDETPILKQSITNLAVLDVASGYEHLLFIDDMGYIYGFGTDSHGEFANSGNRQGDYYYTTVNVDSNAQYTNVFAGAYSSFALDSYGYLYAWGMNNYGQLGFDSSGANVLDITNVAGEIGEDYRWKTIAPGYYHTLGIQIDGSLWAWGKNNDGQLGNGSTVNVTNGPVRIGTDEWVSISVGTSHSVGVKADGTLWMWGKDTGSSIGDSTTPQQLGTDTNWGGVMAGGNNTYAVNEDGYIYVWGDNNYGVLATENTTAVQTPTALDIPAMDSLTAIMNAYIGGDGQIAP